MINAQRYSAWLQSLSPESLARISEHVSADVHFRDPFNDVTGREAMAHVFADMFERVDDVRFTVTQAACDGVVCLLAWHFHGRLRSRPWDIDGCSVIRFGDDGLVVEHIDHWDAASGLYERLPLIGGVLRFLRRRVSAA